MMNRWQNRCGALEYTMSVGLLWIVHLFLNAVMQGSRDLSNLSALPCHPLQVERLEAHFQILMAESAQNTPRGCVLLYKINPNSIHNKKP